MHTDLYDENCKREIWQRDTYIKILYKSSILIYNLITHDCFWIHNMISAILEWIKNWIKH